MSEIQARAVALHARGVYLGGPVKDFEQVGRMQLITLLQAGLKPESKVLDFGCGALRAGYWLMRFLNPNCYFGIEPSEDRLRVGLEEVVERDVLDRARPRFAHNDDFDLSVFGERFDFVLARSIWTHASKDQITTMLDSFRAVADGVMLTSYIRAGWRGDYKGAGWRGRSHESDTPGLVHHRKRWIDGACRARGLVASELPDEYNKQRWLRIEAT